MEVMTPQTAPNRKLLISPDLVAGRAWQREALHLGDSEYDAFVLQGLSEWKEDMAAIEAAESELRDGAAGDSGGTAAAVESEKEKMMHAAQRLKGSLYTVGLIEIGNLARELVVAARAFGAGTPPPASRDLVGGGVVGGEWRGRRAGGRKSGGVQALLLTLRGGGDAGVAGGVERGVVRELQRRLGELKRSLR
jgi:hypothetical protein